MRTSLLFLCSLFLATHLLSAAEVYNAKTARADAEKIVRDIDQEKYIAAMTVPMALSPKAQARAWQMLNQKGELVGELSKIKALHKEYGPIKHRVWVQTRRINFPFFTVPRYRVIFRGESPKGKVKEDVVLSRYIVETPNKSHILTEYSCKVGTP